MKNLRQKYHMDSLAALLLFGVFAVCVLSVLLLGADAYRRLTERDQAAYDRRTAVQYLATKVRQADACRGITVGNFTDSPWQATQDTLFLSEEIDGETYLTRIYYYDGYIRELFGEAGEVFAKEDGEKVLAARNLTFSNGPGSQILAVVTDSSGESTRLFWNLRSEEEAMP